MYILVNRVGDNFGVLDTNDGVIDWLSGEKIKHLAHRGIQIAGVNKNGFEPQSYKIAST